jgi:hypothetical protein
MTRWERKKGAGTMTCLTRPSAAGTYRPCAETRDEAAPFVLKMLSNSPHSPIAMEQPSFASRIDSPIAMEQPSFASRIVQTATQKNRRCSMTEQASASNNYETPQAEIVQVEGSALCRSGIDESYTPYPDEPG